MRFHYTLAGPGSRLVAWLVDMSVVMLLVSILGTVMGFASLWFGNYALAVYGVASFVLFIGYWIVLEMRWQGRTLGKRLLGLRVVGELGLPLDFSQVLLRNLLRTVDLLPGAGGVAVLFCALQRHHRRLGDLVAATLVVRERRPPRPAAILRGEGAAELSACRDALALPSDLGRRLSREEREFLLDLCRRRDDLFDSVRLPLFAEVASSYRQLLGLRQPPGISDERLVLAICDELLRE